MMNKPVTRASRKPLPALELKQLDEKNSYQMLSEMELGAVGVAARQELWLLEEAL